MAAMQYLYFDWLNSDNPDEPIAVHQVPYVTTWEKVYGFSVVPADLEPELRRHVRGAQAQLWTEYIATRDELDYMAFPRLCAFSEVAWGSTTTLRSSADALKSILIDFGRWAFSIERWTKSER